MFAVCSYQYCKKFCTIIIHRLIRFMMFTFIIRLELRNSQGMCSCNVLFASEGKVYERSKYCIFLSNISYHDNIMLKLSCCNFYMQRNFEAKYKFKIHQQVNTNRLLSVTFSYKEWLQRQLKFFSILTVHLEEKKYYQ